MSFLNLIQEDLCHPDHMRVDGKMICCDKCKTCLNIYEYITRETNNYFRSSELAQAFYECTGDKNVPMNFTLVQLDGIFPKTVVGQSLSRVKKGLVLLKALNAPFTTQPQVDHCQDMDSFLLNFINIIKEHPESQSKQARMILDNLMTGMYNLLSDKSIVDPFETYFKTFVPYVQQCFPQWQPISVPPYPNLAVDLLIHLQISSKIRKTFGRYSIPFDVIHVMVISFICSIDMDVVGNWVLDFMARICRGEYFWKQYPECPFVQSMQEFVDKEITFDLQRQHYDTLKPIKNGTSIEHYSTFWKQFYELQLFVKSKLCKNDNPIHEYAFAQMFPAVCFNDHADQLGFMMGYNYLMQTIFSNKGFAPKGTFKKAKRIHQTVSKFIGKIQNFESIPLQWTMNTFELFLASDPDYEIEIANTFELLMSDNQDGN